MRNITVSRIPRDIRSNRVIRLGRAASSAKPFPATVDTGKSCPSFRPTKMPTHAMSHKHLSPRSTAGNGCIYFTPPKSATGTMTARTTFDMTAFVPCAAPWMFPSKERSSSTTRSRSKPEPLKIRRSVLRIRPVTGKALRRENRPDAAIEAQRLGATRARDVDASEGGE